MRLILLAVLLVSGAALADPPKRHLSWWDAMLLWQGPPKQEQVQDKPREQERQHEHRWKKPRPPCECLSPRTGGEAVNYPPYDVEP